MKKIVGVLGLFFLSYSSVNFAFELTAAPCKIVDGWRPLFGKCAANNTLNGLGGAIKENLFVMGEFTSGLPNGQAEFSLLSSNGVSDLRDAAFSSVTNATQYVSAIEQSFHFPTQREIDNRCALFFVNGKIAAKEIICKILDNNNAVTIKIMPFDEKVRLVFDPDRGLHSFHNAKLVMDVPELELKTHYKTFQSGMASDHVKGTADSVEFLYGGSSLEIKALGLLGSYTSSLDTPRKNDRSINVSGYINLKCVPNKCAWSGVEYNGGAAVDKRYLTNEMVNGQTYQYVILKDPKNKRCPLNKCAASNYVYYFKSPDGLEFDGSEGKCPEGGFARLVRTNEKLDIAPSCGKVIAPNGQSFTGSFDGDGRPIVN